MRVDFKELRKVAKGRLSKIQVIKSELLTFVELSGSAFVIEKHNQENASTLQTEICDLYAANKKDVAFMDRAVVLADLYAVPIQREKHEINFIDFKHSDQARNNSIGFGQGDFLENKITAADFEIIKQQAEEKYKTRADEILSITKELELMRK